MDVRIAFVVIVVIVVVVLPKHPFVLSKGICPFCFFPSTINICCVRITCQMSDCLYTAQGELACQPSHPVKKSSEKMVENYSNPPSVVANRQQPITSLSDCFHLGLGLKGGYEGVCPDNTYMKGFDLNSSIVSANKNNISPPAIGLFCCPLPSLVPDQWQFKLN